MSNVEFNNLRIKQEKQNNRIMIILFYIVFFLYEIILKSSGYYKLILKDDDYTLFSQIQLFLYLGILLILPVLLLACHRKMEYKVKYLFFILYILVYTSYEIIVYSMIDMTYNTATIIDMLFILLSPIYVSKRYFFTVASILSVKLMFIGIIMNTPSIMFSFLVMFSLEIVAFIILMMFSTYLKKTRELYEAESEILLYKSIAYKDELTGVYNMRYINLELHELEVTKERDFGIVMLDIDNFKDINDTYNHVIGDQVLKLVVENIKNQLGLEDLMGRFGGDEFILILKDKTFEEVMSLLEIIRSSLEKSPIQTTYDDKEISLNLTSSFGVYYLYKHDNKRPLEALKEADNLLLKAKQNGKNQISYINQ